jgi:hypothetical protein
MRATTHLFVNEPERDAEVRALLERAGFAVAASGDTFHEVAAPSESDALVRLRDDLRGAGIEWFERREHEYSDDELRGYPLLSLFITSAEAGMGGPTHGTEFDLSAYAEDALSAASDVSWTYERFGNSKLREDFSESHFAAPQLLVSPPVRDVLLEANVRNVRFLPVRAAA